MMQTEDGQIISQCLNGDSAMFGFLVEKYKEGVYALAYSKLGNFHDAQDITQEAFIKAFQKLRTLKQRDSFALWISAIANNLCKNFIRSISRRPDSEFTEDQSPNTVDHSSMDSYRGNILHESLQEALDSLPEVYRQVLILHYFSGYRNMDIARLLGISLRTVAERLSIGRERLREEMVTMMGRAFETQKLPAGFTFRVVEAVKHIKIEPASISKGIPWGLSLATGILFVALGMNPQIMKVSQVNFNPAISGESSVAETGDFQVGIVKISDNPSIQNAFLTAPKGEGGTWARREDMPDALWGHSASMVDDKIYIIGGGPDNNAPSTVVKEYDPATDKWTKKADMPTARGVLSTAVVKGKIYAIGGSRFWGDVGLSTVEEYDPLSDKWTEKADMPTIRCGHTSSAVNSKIYVIGGATAWSYLSAVEEYDPATDKWTKKADMPTATGLHSASVLNGKIYVIGGRTTVNPALDVSLSTLEEYDPVADTWTKKANMPTARFYLSSNAINGKIYAIGGSQEWQGNALSLVEEYDPVTDTWTRRPDMLTARFAIASSVVNGKIYTFGGVDRFLGGAAFGNPFSTVEVYTPEDTQSVSPQGKRQSTWGETKSF